MNMLRRDFSRGLVATSAVAAMAAPVARAQGARTYKEGADYLSLEKRASTEAGAGKIEVVEFFWYSCPHCNQFEPTLEAWIKKLPKDVVMRRAPVAFRPDFEPQQRLYFAIEAMDMVDKLHAKVFYAIHVEKQQLNTPSAIFAWVEKQGVDKAKFEATFNSFSVATKSRKATQLQNEFQVDGVPALGIAGRFYTSGSMAQTMARALEVTDYLVAEVRKGK
jgi:protein dithiol oxidoreductase (disulfide-forming)